MRELPLKLLRKDKREILAAFAELLVKAKWAMIAVESDGEYTILATDGPSRYEMIGALEDMKFDLLEGRGVPDES